jgi:hypothetical protein
VAADEPTSGIRNFDLKKALKSGKRHNDPVQTRRIRLMNSIGREWREGKVRRMPGNSPHDPMISRWVSFHVSGEFTTTLSPPLHFRNSKNHPEALIMRV